MTSRVLVLSTTTGYQLRSFGEAAADLGVELIFATDRCQTLDDPWRDGAIAVRFYDEDAALEAIVTAAADRPLAGVLAVGDRPVVLAARAARALGLPGNDPDAARASANKRLARARLARAGLPAPQVEQLTTASDIGACAAALRYPVVVKPVALSGSRGVIRADTPRELIAAFRRVAALLARPEIRALRTGVEGEVLIESFIPGREYAIEGVLTQGRFTPFAVFDKPDPLDGPFFEERIYVTPSRIGAPGERAIVAAVARAAAALGLTHGPVHAECRVNADGVFVLEVAARPIGGLCSRVLRFQADDRPWSLEHVLLRHALGEDVAHLARETEAAAVMMIPIPGRGVFKRVAGADAARARPFVEEVRITAKIDHLLEPLPEGGSYLGFIFARAPEPAAAEAAVRDAHARLTFTIAPAIDVI
jgi:formate-dependent phosphoribosylglycinamide formyltransferase (GAR transformylase)